MRESTFEETTCGMDFFLGLSPSLIPSKLERALLSWKMESTVIQQKGQEPTRPEKDPFESLAQNPVLKWS